MGRIHVVHVVGKMDIGGTEKVVTEIVKNINQDKFKLSVVVHSDETGHYAPILEENNTPVYHAPRFKGYNYIKYIKYWNNFLSNLDKNTIVHCHVRGPASIILRIAKKYGHKTLSHSHGMTNGTGIASMMKTFLQGKISAYSDYRLACSRDAGNWLYGKEFLLDRDRDKIWLNAFNYNDYRFDDKNRQKIIQNNDWENCYIIGTVGRLTWEKNFKFLVELFEDLPLHMKEEVRIVIIGDGPEKDNISKKIDELKLKNYIILLGEQQRPEQYLSSFDLFVLPSLKEGLGISALEAQVNGLPVIVSENVPLEVEISENLFQVELSTRKWIDKIIFIKKNIKRDTSTIDSKYDINQYIKEIEKFYKSVIYRSKK